MLKHMANIRWEDRISNEEVLNKCRTRRNLICAEKTETLDGLDMWNEGKISPLWEEIWICRSMEENQLEGSKWPGRPMLKKIWNCLTSARRQHMIEWSGEDSLHARPQWEGKDNKWTWWWWGGIVTKVKGKGSIILCLGECAFIVYSWKMLTTSQKSVLAQTTGDLPVPCIHVEFGYTCCQEWWWCEDSSTKPTCPEMCYCIM